MRTPTIVTTLQDYSRAAYLADVVSGVTVALVALPLSIAIASGEEPAAGLVTAIVAGFLISALGGSRVQIGGPTGAFIVVVAGVIATHGYDGLVLATLLAGVILVVAALLRAGGLVAWVPEPVVDGFAVIIATSQLEGLFGLTFALTVFADLTVAIGVGTMVGSRSAFAAARSLRPSGPRPSGERAARVNQQVPGRAAA